MEMLIYFKDQIVYATDFLLFNTISEGKYTLDIKGWDFVYCISSKKGLITLGEGYSEKIEPWCSENTWKANEWDYVLLQFSENRSQTIINTVNK